MRTLNRPITAWAGLRVWLLGASCGIGAALAEELLQVDAHFRDPFNNACGGVAIEAIFRRMFVHTEQSRFIIGERVVQGGQAFVTWLFVFHLRGVPYQICGGSQLRFNADGLVVMPRDYWDAAEELLEKLPLIGAPIRWLCGHFRVPMRGAAATGRQA